MLETAEWILAAKPEALFPDPEAIHERFKDLAKVWHPDRNPKRRKTAEEVFKHIGELKGIAEKMRDAGRWPGGILEIVASDGRKFRLAGYLKEFHSDACDGYICRASVVYVFHKDAEDLGKRFVDQAKFKYADKKMEGEVARYLPRVSNHHKKDGGGYVVVVDKTPDLIRVTDLQDHMGGNLLPRHSAWITSSLYNISCYLEYARKSHNAISPSTYFVSPALHSGCLLGGWEFGADYGQKLKALPARTIKYLGKGDLTAGVARDLGLIRATMREMLGDGSGMTMKSIPDFPANVADWLLHPSSGKAQTDYVQWHTALETGYGKRRFTKLPVMAADVYAGLTKR